MSRNRNVQVLYRQRIDAGCPGSILRNFETLLEFIGADGVRAAGKYHFLPIERLGELDAKMTNPLRPRLKRPQQRSFPHIDGLYLLLRATRLGVPKGMGKKTGMLVLDPAMLDQWRTMNATEHYFNDFSFPGQDGSQVRVVCPYIDDAEAWTDDYSIGNLPLAEGQSMEFSYDYGTDWRFDVKLEKAAPPNPRMKKPRLVESHGKPPKEYGDWEDG